jgi:ABC-type glutathione transport system ATPase component
MSPPGGSAFNVSEGIAMSDEVILEASDLTKHFPTGASKFLQRPTQVVQAVDGVSLSLRRGTTLAVVGESGCGKSTLARLLARLIEPTAGSVVLNGVNLTTASSKEMLKMRRDIQVVFQDPYACLNPRHSIGQSIGTPIRIQKTMSRSDERHRVFELMDLVGLSAEHYNRFPHEFSGGQRQRAGIARALALQPKVIIADEPVSALDVSIQAQILNLLRGSIASVYPSLDVGCSGAKSPIGIQTEADHFDWRCAESG